MKKIKTDNVVKFPTSISDGEKEIEAILFASSEPLDEENIDYKRFSGDSLKEILRLSEANENLWHEIFLDNKENLEYIKEKLKKKLL